MSVLAVMGLAALTLATAGVIYQSVGLVHDARRFPPPGQLVDVGGYRLHAVCCGRGAPTVVLESAIAATSLSWARVQADVARFTSVCAYDRAGLGWSDASMAPRTFDRTLNDLHAVLAQLECAAPCVMEQGRRTTGDFNQTQIDVFANRLDRVRRSARIAHLDGVRGVSNQRAVTPSVSVDQVKTDIDAALHRCADVDAQHVDVSVDGPIATRRSPVKYHPFTRSRNSNARRGPHQEFHASRI